MTFTTCLNCIDGRTQLPVINWIKEKYKYDFVDLITEPGIAGLFASDAEADKSVLDKIYLSLTKHDSNHIFIAGHYDCTGYPGNNRQHKAQIYTAVKTIKQLFPAAQVTGLWVNEKWEVEEITT